MGKDLLSMGQSAIRSEFVTDAGFFVIKDIEKRRTGRASSARIVFWGALFGLLFCISALVAAQEGVRADARHVEAAFLRNFAHYITWPEKAFTDPQVPWQICILGSDPFGNVLEKTFEGRTEQGRSFTILRTRKLTELYSCQIVYVAYKVSANRRAALSSLQGQPVLTVSNAPDFLQEGGIIRFDVTDYVELSVNLDQAKAASLQVQTKVLEVSRAVIENGEVHRIR
jgi:hypothetical protein